LTIDKNVVTTANFFLQAETLSGIKASTPFYVFIPPKVIINNAPYFKPKLSPTFTVDIVKD
jgi:hypothetical protein